MALEKHYLDFTPFVDFPSLSDRHSEYRPRAYLLHESLFISRRSIFLYFAPFSLLDEKKLYIREASYLQFRECIAVVKVDSIVRFLSLSLSPGSYQYFSRVIREHRLFRAA